MGFQGEPMSVRAMQSPKTFAQAWSTQFAQVVTAAAGRDGRLSRAEAARLAAEPDTAVFADNAWEPFAASGQQSVSARKLVAQGQAAALAAATRAAGADGRLSAADYRRLPALFGADALELKALNATGPTPGGSLSELKRQVDAATDGMWLTSESDAHVAFLQGGNIGDQPITEALIRERLSAAHDELRPDIYGFHDDDFIPLADRTAEPVRDAHAFLAHRSQPGDPNDPFSVAQAQKWAQLAQVLESNLTDLQLYRFGTVDISVMLVGRTADGELTGVMSAVVET
jgi:hypothetical protein